MKRILKLFVLMVLYHTANAQSSHIFGISFDSRIFTQHKSLANQISKVSEIDRLGIWNEMTGPYYKYTGMRWGFEAALLSNWYNETQNNGWDIAQNVNSLTLGVNYNIGKVSFADKLLIHTGVDLIAYDIMMRNNNMALSSAEQPNGFYWTNVSGGLYVGLETMDYITDNGIFYNLHLGYTITPLSEWKGTAERFKSSLEYVYFGFGFGYDSGYKKRTLRKI